VSGISGPVTLRYSLVYGACWTTFVDVDVKRYAQVSDPAGIVANMSIGCQSSFFLPSRVPVNGYGVWTVDAGSGSVVDSDSENETAVTSVMSSYNRYLFTVAAPGCVPKVKEFLLFSFLFFSFFLFF